MELEGLGTPLQRELGRPKWWQDLGIPHPLSGRVDSRTVRAQVYLLDKRDQIIAI